MNKRPGRKPKQVLGLAMEISGPLGYRAKMVYESCGVSRQSEKYPI